MPDELVSERHPIFSPRSLMVASLRITQWLAADPYLPILIGR
jgi:hypothetical protein